MAKLGRVTQGDYRYSNKIINTKRRLEKMMSSEEWEYVEKYEIAMVKSSLTDGAKVKNYDTILGITRLLKSHRNHNWLDLNQHDIDMLVVTIMNKYSDGGKETNTTTDFKRFLKIWYRFIKLGSRSFKVVGDPIETRGIFSKPVESKITRMQLITPQELKKLLDVCNNLRDKALIHVHYDAGTRIGEILSVQIKHLKYDQIGYTIAVDGKTGTRSIRILESNPTLALWLGTHPEKDNPEAYLFPNLKTVWKGNKLSYSASVNMLNKTTKEAKMRHLFWHLFRHTECTRTAIYMKDQITKNRHGWTKNSKMAARYSHVTNQDAENVFLEHHGILPDSQKETSVVPIQCSVCKTHNAYDADICQQCGKPLSLQQAVLHEDTIKKEMTRNYIDVFTKEEIKELKKKVETKVMKNMEKEFKEKMGKEFENNN